MSSPDNFLKRGSKDLQFLPFRTITLKVINRLKIEPVKIMSKSDGTKLCRETFYYQAFLPKGATGVKLRWLTFKHGDYKECRIWPFFSPDYRLINAI